MTDKRISTAETAKIIGVSPQTVSGWRWKSMGPPYEKVGNRIWYMERDVRLWMIEHRTPVRVVPSR